MTTRLQKGYLQWRCRRGTKELDVILTRYLEKKYNDLSDQELQLFDKLLDTQDTELWYWLSGKISPESDSLKQLIFKITQK